MGTLDYQQSGLGGIAKGIKDYHAALLAIISQPAGPSPPPLQFVQTPAQPLHLERPSHGDLSTGGSEMDYQQNMQIVKSRLSVAVHAGGVQHKLPGVSGNADLGVSNVSSSPRPICHRVSGRPSGYGLQS